MTTSILTCSLTEVKSFVQDVTPALLANIEAEFDKVAQMEPPQPTRTSVSTHYIIIVNKSLTHVIG